MAAATQNRNTPYREGTSRGHGVAAGALCHAGTVAVMNATGFAEPATTATGLVALGVFEAVADNRGGADGEKVVEIRRGNFRLANSSVSDEITVLDIGKVCYLVDDQTVAKTDGTASRSVAGIVDGVDEGGVWVNIDPTNATATA